MSEVRLFCNRWGLPGSRHEVPGKPDQRLDEGLTMRAKTMFYVCAVMTCVNALVSAGFSLAMLTSQSSAHVAAMYAVARSVPLAIAALVTMGKRSYVGVINQAPLLGPRHACAAVA